jgi:hypothetical protein
MVGFRSDRRLAIISGNCGLEASASAARINFVDDLEGLRV